jgi:hypothetical protein
MCFLCGKHAFGDDFVKNCAKIIPIQPWPPGLAARGRKTAESGVADCSEEGVLAG